ncbi:MAG: hypothetical protein JWN73_3597 [Betaproteobacteria bacterium]|nr:hypothetical protein [Betaproteobacteria bacterium]
MPRLFNKPTWSFFREHPVFTGCIVLVLGLIAWGGYRVQSASAEANAACALAVEGRPLADFGVAMRERGYAVKGYSTQGDQVVWVEFKGLPGERFVCTATGREGTIRSAEVNHLD